MPRDHTTNKGRAAQSNLVSRYDDWTREDFDDGWFSDDGQPLRTELIPDTAKSIIATNQSPDVPFEQSINPYRGCEHGCIYCYARPSHAWLGYSPGLDFESKIFYKQNAAELLRQTFDKKSYRCKVIALGANTDAYQPIERKLQITKQLLEVFWDYQHPLGIVTKSALVERDIELLAKLSERRLCHVLVSVTTLDNKLSRTMEPRAASPKRRLQIIENLRNAGITVGVLVAPVIPVLTDPELEMILQAVKDAGAQFAGKVLLRLPLEVEPLFQEWLGQVAPNKAEHVMNRIKDSHEGKAYRSEFGTRMTGSGIYADMISQRFKKACRSLGLDQPISPLDCSLFQRTDASSKQLNLF